MSALKRLEQWFHSQCDGDWEHEEGITIETLDNPGWAVDIDLVGTDLEDKGFELTKIERKEDDWILCFVKDGKFSIRCGPRNLEEGIECFLQWAYSLSGESGIKPSNYT